MRQPRFSAIGDQRTVRPLEVGVLVDRDDRGATSPHRQLRDSGVDAHVVERDQCLWRQPEEGRRKRRDRSAGTNDECDLAATEWRRRVGERAGEPRLERGPGLIARATFAGADPGAERAIEDLLKPAGADALIASVALEPDMGVGMVGEDVA